MQHGKLNSSCESSTKPKDTPVLLTSAKYLDKIIFEKYHQCGVSAVEVPLQSVVIEAWLKVIKKRLDASIEMRDVAFANTKQKKLARSILVSVLSEALNNNEIAKTLNISGMTVANSVNTYKAFLESEKLDDIKDEIISMIAPLRQEARSKSVKEGIHTTEKNDLPNNIELLIRQKIKQRRKQLNMSIGRAAAKLNITAQQWHKYEMGENRVPAGRLFEISVILGQPISFFFPEEEATPPSVENNTTDRNLFTKEQKGEIVRIIKSFVENG